MSQTINLASARLGAVAVSASDDFFADRSRMLADDEPVFIDGKYDDHGKWMDGWESRRKRGPGHDHCLVRLACPGLIERVEIDTRHFTGNYAPAASLEACLSADGDPGEDAEWRELLPIAPLAGDSRQEFAVAGGGPVSHVRLHIYPDGGVARLRVWGRPEVDWSGADGVVDLAAALTGGVALACSDAHYGSMQNLLAPGRGINMGDGWETRRRREPGFDWVIVELGHPGVVERIEVDTAHFKGNYPDRCSLQAAFLPGAPLETVIAQSIYWSDLLTEQKLSADHVHVFEVAAEHRERVSHVRFNIVPDGGVSRLRLFGTPAHG